MSRPGTSVTLLDTPNIVSLPTDTGTLFITGLAERGTTEPTLVQSLNSFVTKFGSRQTYSSLYDYMETFFREGGNRAFIGRVVGPAATSGELDLLDEDDDVSLTATAIGPGAWSANYKLVVYASGDGFGIRIQDLTTVVLEDSGFLADQAAAINWALNSNYIRLSLGEGELIPDVLAATVLSTGDDDRSNITDTHWDDEQALFVDDLGPGQVAQCGRTGSTAHNQLVSHVDTHNRVALLDLTDSPTPGTLIGNLPTGNPRKVAAFAPWVTIPGLTVGTVRTVPASALVAGLINRNDNIRGPNAASAGAKGIAKYVTGLTQPNWDDDDRSNLNTAGVNVIRNIRGGIRVYGWRSLANPVNDISWLDFGNARLFMALSAELNEVGEGYLFEDITLDTIAGFNDALVGVLLFHFNQGSLYGANAEDAFTVDTGPEVNTASTIANLELHAICGVKMSVFAEYIPIQVVKRQITDSLTL